MTNIEYSEQNLREKALFYQRAIQLNYLFTHNSWPLLVENMQQLVLKAQQRVLNYEGADANVLVGLQHRARSFTEFYQTILSTVAATAELAEIGPAYLVQQEPLPGVQ